MPEDLYYEENHYWIRVEGEVLFMGMDDFAQVDDLIHQDRRGH